MTASLAKGMSNEIPISICFRSTRWIKTHCTEPSSLAESRRRHQIAAACITDGIRWAGKSSSVMAAITPLLTQHTHGRPTYRPRQLGRRQTPARLPLLGYTGQISQDVITLAALTFDRVNRRQTLSARRTACQSARSTRPYRFNSHDEQPFRPASHGS